MSRFFSQYSILRFSRHGKMGKDLSQHWLRIFALPCDRYHGMWSKESDKVASRTNPAGMGLRRTTYMGGRSEHWALGWILEDIRLHICRFLPFLLHVFSMFILIHIFWKVVKRNYRKIRVYTEEILFSRLERQLSEGVAHGNLKAPYCAFWNQTRSS